MRKTAPSISPGLMSYMILSVIITLVPVSCSRSAFESPVTGAYDRLDAIKDQKKTDLTKYLESLKQKARSIGSDEVMTKFFKIKNNYHNLKKASEPPEEVRISIETLGESIKSHYLANYLTFYDILCINTDGTVFHTIRKQGDYLKNLFTSELRTTALSTHLASHPGESFVDFQFYEISDIPSAFFVEPVLDGSRIIGWFVLQFSVNKLDNMFGVHDGLGRTGEVILVNKERYLLTNSRFDSESTILRKRLSEDNISDKFRDRSGHKTVIDYRGYRVLSSFDVFPVLGSEWLLIVKINESEIFSDYYRANKKDLEGPLFRDFPVIPPNRPLPAFSDKKRVEVDMDEFRRIDGSEIIFTHGVSTCTAVIVTLPGRFSYLSHISNIDKQYGGTQTDLIRRMFELIRDFDVFRYEIQQLQILVAAPHKESISGIVDELLARGVFLSQITFLHRPDLWYINVHHDYSDNLTLVEWVRNDEKKSVLRQSAEDFPSLEERLKTLINLPSAGSNRP
jgi:hypothetical protein